MQFARVNGVTHHYQIIGAPEGKPTLVFANSLGTDFRIWRDVIVRLAGEVAIVTYDKRGHGLSDLGETPYTMDGLVDDLASLLDHLGADPAVIVGLSVGGAIAQGLAISRPDLVRGLVLAGTSARFMTREAWQERIDTVEADGLAAYAPAVTDRWFADAYKGAAGDALDGWTNMVARQPQAGYLATCAALRDFDGRGRLGEITVPAIAVAGENDLACPPDQMADMARALPDCRYEMLKACGHIIPVEQPELFTEIVRAFMADADIK